MEKPLDTGAAGGQNKEQESQGHIENSCGQKK